MSPPAPGPVTAGPEVRRDPPAPGAPGAPAPGRPAAGPVSRTGPPHADAAARSPAGRARTLGRARSVRPAQVVAVQAAALAALPALPASWWWRASAAALLVLVTGAALLRRRERWLYAWAGVLRRHRRRTRRPAPVDPVAGVEVEEFVDRAGTRFGILRDGRTVTTVLAVEPAVSSAVAAPAPDVLDLATVADVLADRDVRLAAVQAVLRCTPAPSARLDPASAPAVSYRQLSGGLPTHRELLVCLRLDPALCAGAVAGRGGGSTGALRALASVTARVSAGLDAATGARVRPLGPDEVRSAVDAGLGSSSGPLTERWGRLESPETVHLSFRLTGWGPGRPAALLEELSRTPSLTTVLGLTFTPAPTGPAHLRLVLRVVAPGDRAAAAEEVVVALARRAGARLVRLDGEHREALAATLPTGGGDWPGAAAHGALWQVDRPWLADQALPLDRGGLVLGFDTHRRAAVLRLFGDRGATVCLSLDPRVPLVLVHRAVATGARVTVVTTRPDRWLTVRRLSGSGLLAVVPPAALAGVGLGGTPDRPHLVVLDLPDRPEPPQVPARSWQTVLTVLPDLSTRSLTSARSAGVAVLSRLARGDAITAGPFLGLPSGSDRVLTGLGDDQVAVVEHGRLVVVSLTPTAAEAGLVAAAAGSAADAPDPRVRPQHRPRQRQ